MRTICRIKKSGASVSIEKLDQIKGDCWALAEGCILLFTICSTVKLTIFDTYSIKWTHSVCYV